MGKIKILVMCGTGIATSTVAMGKMKNWVEEENLENVVDLHQGKIAEELNYIDQYDAVVSTTIVPDDIQDKVINGVGLLTGVGADEIYAEIKQKIQPKLQA